VPEESGGRAGLLLVRSWIEPHAQDQLRARITSTLDVRRAGQVTATATSIDAVLVLVREWLEAFARETN
jgi:hypothetical protein